MSPSTDAAALVLRSPRPGDLGWIVHRQALLYATEYGWDWRFEGLLAKRLESVEQELPVSCLRLHGLLGRHQVGNFSVFVA